MRAVHRLLREPLLHFLIIGAVLVGVSERFGDEAAPAQQRIEIGPGEIESLITIFQRT